MIAPFQHPKSEGMDSGLLKTDYRSDYKTVMKTYSVTEAKPILGKLADKALSKQAVFIRRGQRILQLVEATVPEPIPSLPEGYFAITPERAAFINSMPVDSEPIAR